MVDESLVGKCGLYCGACSIFRAERDNQEWRERIAAKNNCSLEQVRCNGCGSLGSDCWGNECKIVLCTRDKGINFCFECQEYENDICNKLNNLANNYLENGVNLRDNLKNIQDGRAEEWLEESRKKFTCKSCGNPIAVWNTNCHHCGVEIYK
jgi:hypothetical protein